MQGAGKFQAGAIFQTQKTKQVNDEQTETLQAEIGQQLRAMRKKLNLTLKQVAAQIKKPYPEISLIETGNRKTNLHTLEQLASAYGYTVKIKFVKTKS